MVLNVQRISVDEGAYGNDFRKWVEADVAT